MIVPMEVAVARIESGVDYLDYEVVEPAVNLGNINKKKFIVLRIFGTILDEDINYTTKVVAPESIDSYNVLAEVLTGNVIWPRIETAWRKAGVEF